LIQLWHNRFKLVRDACFVSPAKFSLRNPAGAAIRIK
jgi:hypothetical protein